MLGSTGSIGRQTLEVVEQLPVRVAALTAGQNVERMAGQCRRFRPQLAVMGTEEAAQRLREGSFSRRDTADQNNFFHQVLVSSQQV